MMPRLFWATGCSLAGVFYENGEGVDQDYAAAAALYRQAAEQDHMLAQYALAMMYRRGIGVPQDFAEARRWLRLVAERGYAVAQVNLAFLYRDGLGVEQDLDEALRWFRKAAARGHPGGSLSRYSAPSRARPCRASSEPWSAARRYHCWAFR